jgi:hypothetical protein
MGLSRCGLEALDLCIALLGLGGDLLRSISGRFLSIVKRLYLRLTIRTDATERDRHLAARHCDFPKRVRLASDELKTTFGHGNLLDK